MLFVVREHSCEQFDQYKVINFLSFNVCMLHPFTLPRTFNFFYYKLKRRSTKLTWSSVNARWLYRKRKRQFCSGSLGNT